MTNYEAMKADTNVLAHIRSLNEARATEAREEGRTFHFTTPEDLASEFPNVYEFEREMAWSSYSDLHKEEHGFRPRPQEIPSLEEIAEKMARL